jgi:GrpB-like predicted nucleotidyltransferase (UPF0157 family)
VGGRIGRREWLAAAWFGPKGFASVVYGLLVLTAGIRGGEELFALIALTVVASIVAHSSTDVVVARWFRDDAQHAGEDDRDGAREQAGTDEVEVDPAVRVVDPDPAWPAQFAAEAARISQALGPVALRVEHVGSTAVPGLAAKPIIDIQVSVAQVQPMDRYRGALEGLGYQHTPYPDQDGVVRYPFFGRPPTRPRRFHVHVAQADSHHERRHLAVRDFLRAHPDQARAYARVKRDAAAGHPGDRPGYMAAKQQFVEDLERRALAWDEQRAGHAPPT